MALQIAILGSVEPRVDGAVVSVPAGKQRALLSLLAIRAPDSVSAEAAAEALWPRAAPQEATRSLHVTVSRLRRSLGPAGSSVETVASGYRLAIAPEAVDARRFETLLTGARAAGTAHAAHRLLDEALALWRGRALADVAFESFAQGEIARLEELRVAALEERIEARLSGGEHALVVAELEQLSAEHPSRERLIGLLMLALYRCERQTEALDAYQRGRQRLVDDLGLEPSPELQRLQESILRHDAALELPGQGAREPRPTNLPADPRRLIGREAELELLSGLLTGEERLVTILGLGGTGKTRLAVAAATRLLSAFEGGAWLVPLAGVRDPVGLMPAIAAALGVVDADGRTPEAALAQRLRARPSLLVLDNFEQLVDSAPGVEALLEQAPGTRALVTSQLALRVARERLLRLGPLSADSALALFDERARAAAPEFDVRRHRDAVEAICARVDGMPLGVELAAARVSAIAPDELLARLDRSLGVLARGPRDLAQRHRSLRAALEWTHDLLEPDERILLARLAAFAGPAPLDAVEAVAAVNGNHRPVDALDCLSGLIDASFVQREDSREHGVRYSAPQAVRDFAAEQLTASGDEPAVRSAHAAHIASVSEAFRGDGTPRAVSARVYALEAEQRVALDWTRANAPELHTRVASALALVLIDTGRSRDAYSELGSALERAAAAGPARGYAAVMRAYAAGSIGLHVEHSALLEEGLTELRSTDDLTLLTLGLRVAGVFWGFAGDRERSFAYLSEALTLARRRSDIGDLIMILLWQASLLADMGRLDEAERLIEEAAPLVRQTGDSSLDCGARAEVAVARGNWALAARLYAEDAMGVGRNTGALAVQLRMAAIALARVGADEEALEIQASADGIAAAIGETTVDPWSVKHGSALGEARERVGPERAARAARRGRELSESDSAARALELVEAVGGTASS